MAPKAVLWDMDGTLVDTEPYWMTAEHQLVGEHGGQWTDELGLSLVGNDLLTSAAVIQQAGVDLPAEQIVHRLMADVAQLVRERPPWRPGALELLTQLRGAGVRCALVTMSWRELADAVVGQLPGEFFETSITGDMVTAGKPDPECYTLACTTLGVAPGDCVAIEDSNTGARAAVAAGVPTLAVTHLVELVERPGQVILDSLAGVQVSDLVAHGQRAAVSFAEQVSRC